MPNQPVSENGMNALQPCPFCGGEASVSKVGGGWVAGCDAGQTRRRDDTCCRANAIAFYHPDRDKAIAAWNRRAPVLESALSEEDPDNLVGEMDERLRLFAHAAIQATKAPNLAAIDHWVEKHNEQKSALQDLLRRVLRARLSVASAPELSGDEKFFYELRAKRAASRVVEAGTELMVGMQHCESCGFNNHWTHVALTNCKNCHRPLVSAGTELSADEQIFLADIRRFTAPEWDVTFSREDGARLLAIIDRLTSSSGTTADGSTPHSGEA